MVTVQGKITQAELAREMHSILTQLELLSHVSAANYAPSGHSIPHSSPPLGVGRPPHLYWRARWDRAVYEDMEEEHAEATTITHRRRKTLGAAQTELESLRKRPHVKVLEETKDELEARVLREGDGWTVEDVARHCRCTAKFVRKTRLRAGVSVATGREPKDIRTPFDDDERSRALKLKQEGYSERGIRMVLGIGGSKLQRLLRETA